MEESEPLPVYGMEFDSLEAAYKYYNSYGTRIGFSIRKEGSHKAKDGKITSSLFVCCKEGFKTCDQRDTQVRNPRAETRTGCRARMNIKLNRATSKYWVNDFDEEHNHIFVTKEHVHMIPYHRGISDSQIVEIDVAYDSGLSLRSSFELMGREVGGESLGFLKRDQKNYLRTKRQKMLAYDEAGSILKYFQNQSTKNPSFFYAVQLDNEEKITNIFWTYARMILDYGQFGDGDAVNFDTTYGINGKSCPFAVFSGFNHHRETVIFGAALMYDETADSFTWLFETFLEAMSNKHPQTIFSDQDAVIAKAISDVMPNTHHRLCIWHMMQNALKHMNSIFKGPNGVRNVLGKFIYDYEEKEEFISAWDTMLDTYNLEREMGQALCQESMVSWNEQHSVECEFECRVKKVHKSDLNFVEFLNQFERVLNDKLYKEVEAEYDLSFRLPKVKVGAAMLIQAGYIYKKNVFEDFQKEYVESLNLCAEIRYNGEGFTTYYVEHYAHETYKNGSVTRDSENNVSCCCRLFEMRGILCSHVIKVLTSKLDVMRIPSQYILKRWTRNARAETIKDVHGNDIQIDPKLEQITWYRSLCSILRTISCRASKTQKTYDLVVEEATKLLKSIEDVLQSNVTYQEPDGNTSTIVHENIVTEGGVTIRGLKKKLVKSRGRKRIKSSLEISMKSTNKRRLKKGTTIPKVVAPPVKKHRMVSLTNKGKVIPETLDASIKEHRKPPSVIKQTAIRENGAASIGKYLLPPPEIATTSLPGGTMDLTKMHSQKWDRVAVPQVTCMSTNACALYPLAPLSLNWMCDGYFQPNSFQTLLQGGINQMTDDSFSEYSALSHFNINDE